MGPPRKMWPFSRRNEILWFPGKWWDVIRGHYMVALTCCTSSAPHNLFLFCLVYMFLFKRGKEIATNWGQPNKVSFYPPIKTKWLEEKKEQNEFGKCQLPESVFYGFGGSLQSYQITKVACTFSSISREKIAVWKCSLWIMAVSKIHSNTQQHKLSTAVFSFV